MRENRLLLALLVVVLLGCGSGPTRADDQKGDEAKPADKKDEKKEDKAPEKKDDAPSDKKDKDPKAPVKQFKATVKDTFDTDALNVEDAYLWVPQVSLLSGENGDTKRSLQVKRGAAEIEIPFEDIAKIEINEVKEPDRLGITVTFRGTDKGEPIKGTIKSNLQFRGRYGKSQLKATIKLREVKSMTLEEMKAK